MEATTIPIPIHPKISLLGGPQRQRNAVLGLSSGSISPHHSIRRSRDDFDLYLQKMRPEKLDSNFRVETEMLRQQEYLKELVEKLSNELLFYQSKYPSEVITVEKQVPLPPWFFQSETMNPLLHAYETRILDLEKQVKLYQENFLLLERDTKSITTENEELHEKLKNTFQSSIKKLESDSPTLGIAAEEWKDLQEQLRLFEKENKVLLEEQTEYKIEIHRLKEELRSLNEEQNIASTDTGRSRQILLAAKKKILALEHEKMKVVEEFTAVEQKNDKLIKTLDIAESKFKELQKEKSEMSLKLSQLEQIQTEHQTQREQLAQNETLLQQKEAQLFELKEKNSAHQLEANNLQKDKEQLLKQIGESEQRIAIHQQSEFDALQKLREAVEGLESVKLERDSLKVLTESKTSEILRLEEKIKSIKLEYTQLQQQLIEDSKQQHTLAYNALQDELKTAEAEIFNLKTEMDRCKREKESAEAEVYKLIKAAEVEYTTPTNIVSDLTKKLSIAIQERDEAERMFENIKSANKRALNQWEQEREQLNLQIAEALKRLSKIEKETEEVRIAKDNLSHENHKLVKQLQNVKFDQEDAEQSFKERLRDREEEYNKRVTTLERVVETLKEEVSKHELTAKRLQSINEKLQITMKEEITRTIEKSEKIVFDLQSENERYHKRIEELQSKMTFLIKERADLSQILEEQKEEIESLRNQLEYQARRVEDSANQLKTVFQREAEILKERKHHLLEIEKLNFDIEKLKRDRDPLRQSYNYLPIDTSSIYQSHKQVNDPIIEDVHSLHNNPYFNVLVGRSSINSAASIPLATASITASNSNAFKRSFIPQSTTSSTSSSQEISSIQHNNTVHKSTQNSNFSKHFHTTEIPPSKQELAENSASMLQQMYEQEKLLQAGSLDRSLKKKKLRKTLKKTK